MTRRRNSRPLPPLTRGAVTITAASMAETVRRPIAGNATMDNAAAPAEVRAAGAPMLVDVLAVPWSSPSRMTTSGYIEVMRRGAVDPGLMVGLPVIDGHTGQAVGVVDHARDTDVGLVATMRLSDTTLARDLYTLATDGALGASLGFDADSADVTVDRAGIVTRSRVTPRELSLTPLPAYEAARVLVTREAAPMPDYTFTDPSAVTVTADTDPSTPAAEAPAETLSTAPAESRSARPSSRGPVTEYATAADLEAVAARIDATRSSSSSTPAGHPLGRYPSFGDYAAAVFRGDATPAEARALADNLSPASPGVMPPSWLTDVRGIVARSRALIEGTGGALSPGASGLDVSWPYYDGTLAALVGPQATQKTEITSVGVAIKKGTASLVTYAGGSDLAYQLVERSSPSYLDAYMRIMAAAYGVVTEKAYAVALEAAGIDVTGVTLATLYEAVIAAAADVDDATGAPPSIIGISSNQWAKIAGKVDTDGRPLYPPTTPSNAPGTPDGPGAVRGITIAGIPAVRAVGLPDNRAVVLNGEAARWMEDGPRTLAADNVALLGRDVAVYGYATSAAFVPAGIRVLNLAPPA